MGIALILLLGLSLSLCETANILYVTPFTSKSHDMLLRPVGLELARRGHNVTVITAFKEDNPLPNYHQVLVDDVKIWELTGEERPNVFTMVDLPPEIFHEKILWRGGLGITNVVLNSSQVQKFLAGDNKFDLVICEQFYSEATYILAHKYQAPLVLITTFGNCMRHNIVTRNPLQLATMISEFIYLKDPTSFWNRLKNLYFITYEFYWWKYWFLEEQEKLVKKYIPGLPEPVPSLYEMQRNTALMLLNSHFSFDVPTAYLPNLVEIGGIHLTRSNTKLPKDLQKILDNAKDGVVYINFGSNVRSAELPVEKKNALVNVFRKLKQTVIWKWEDEVFENKPDNLYIRNWMPQKEILAHPNIRVFISHGGMIGTQEAIYNGVPIIGIPIYADQYNNLLLAQEHGFCRILSYQDINEENVARVLEDVLNTDVYREKAKEMSARFKDRPLSALDTAMFWIEYVIRNKGAEYMRNPALKLSWVEYHMLDVYAFIVAVSLVLVYIVFKILTVLKSFFGAKSNRAIIKKKKKL